MKILYLCDFFPPFIKGGAEISNYWQAKKLSRKNIKIIILTPKYKNSLKFKTGNSKLKIYWYKLPFMVNKTSPIIFLNPIFFLYLFFNILKVLKKEKIDLIHCQGKYSMPASVLAKWLLKIPLILTLRDYKGICNHGFCLYNNQKSCNMLSFYKKDFLFYYRNYIQKKNIFSFLFQFILSYFGRINTIFLSFFMKKADKLVCVSNYVAKMYGFCGFEKKKMYTIYNFGPEIKFEKGKLYKKLFKKIAKFKYKILYVGKLSLGKGVNMLINTARKILEKRNDVIFIFVGKINYPIKKILSTGFLFLGRVDQDLLFKIISKADLICVPSFWPEPLSRVVLEAYTLKKPVLVSDRGGPKELVSQRRGCIFKPNTKNLEKHINDFLDNKNLKTLGEQGHKFMLRLEIEQMQKLVKLYKSLI